MEGHRRSKKKPKICLTKTLRNDIFELNLSSHLALDRVTWKGIIHQANAK